MSDRDDHRYQALCHEAVLACGADLDAVRRYLDTRIAAMDETSRFQVMKDVERVLAFNPPDRSIWDH